MAQNVKVCEIDESLKPLLRKFRFRKSKDNAAVVMKINKDKLEIVLDEEYEDTCIDELREELPEHQPRYVVYSCTYNHDDGRVSYPLCFIYISPSGCKPELQMMYAGSKLALAKELEMTKIFDVRSVEDLTDEWLNEKLQFFR